jgi:hypothetical protein
MTRRSPKAKNSGLTIGEEKLSQEWRKKGQTYTAVSGMNARPPPALRGIISGAR